MTCSSYQIEVSLEGLNPVRPPKDIHGRGLPSSSALTGIGKLQLSQPSSTNVGKTARVRLVVVLNYNPTVSHKIQYHHNLKEAS